jgi:hypothetical protein
MVRSQLQHVILEIGRRFDLRDFYIIGSSAILAVLPNPPEGALTATRDVDVVPLDDDEHVSDQISFVIGEASEFDFEHGYYAQGVTSETPAYAPRGWTERAVPVRVDAYTGWCMEANDLVLSKLGAGREKDIEFAKAAAALELVQRDALLQRLPDVTCADEHRQLIKNRISALFT